MYVFPGMTCRCTCFSGLAARDQFDRTTFALAQDFLVLVAAGNEGDYGYFSVGNPAVAKNCLAIGASEVPHSQLPNLRKDYLAYFSSLGPTFDNR